jgi:hypothetical protein
MKRFCLFLLLPIITCFAQDAQKPQTFEQFTGKITGNKVRLRAQANLESPIIQQFNKDDIVLVVGEKDNFWAIIPPKEIKGFIYRSYVIDNKVEANKVNIRLSPNTEAFVIGQLQEKDELNDAKVLSQNNKWMEINLPKHISFYIAKDYVVKAGKAEDFTALSTRQADAKNAFNAANIFVKKEYEKNKDEKIFQEAAAKFDAVIQTYKDCPEIVKNAQKNLAVLKDSNLMKKGKIIKAKEAIQKTDDPWKTLEHSFYVTWSTFHPEKSMEDFYNEQTANAITLTGTLKKFKTLKHSPGNFVLLNDAGKPIAFVYSTKVALDKMQDKKIKLTASLRPNNNFAYPAYFVNSVE